MKVSVAYGQRTYGNSEHSKASEVTISGSSNLHITIEYKEAQPGRSWDWLTAGSVGGAEIELRLDDARAIATILLDYCKAIETHDPFEEDMYARLRLREGRKPQGKIIRKAR